MKIRNISSAFLVLVLFSSSCTKKSPLTGKWQYDGGLYNGKKQNPSADFKLQREYQDSTYEGFILEGTNPPEKFNSGIYKVENDSLFITTDYNSQPSQMLGKTVRFSYQINSNKLTLNGSLPNGMVVEEYWKKVE